MLESSIGFAKNQLSMIDSNAGSAKNLLSMCGSMCSLIMQKFNIGLVNDQFSVDIEHRGCTEWIPDALFVTLFAFSAYILACIEGATVRNLSHRPGLPKAISVTPCAFEASIPDFDIVGRPSLESSMRLKPTLAFSPPNAFFWNHCWNPT